jgi:hypothetical protein
MDSKRFDNVTRALSTRRLALTGLVGGVATLLGLTNADEASAHNAVVACRRIADSPRRQACLRGAKRHKRLKHSCKSQPVTVTCAVRCGNVPDNCGKGVTCSCPAGKSCLGNGSCSRTCAVPGDPGDCPAGCLCGSFALEGGVQCRPRTIIQCEQVPQLCNATSQCPLGFFCGQTGCGPDSAPEGRCIPVCPI